MKATIEVVFEAREGQYRNVLEGALTRGVIAVAVAIERGTSPNQAELRNGLSWRSFGKEKSWIDGRKHFDGPPRRSFAQPVIGGRVLATAGLETGREAFGGER